MQIKKIQKTVFENIFVSEDGKYESRCSADVIEYEKKQDMKKIQSNFLYKTNITADASYYETVSEYYVYRCKTENDLKAAINDVLDKEVIYVNDVVINNHVSKNFVKENEIYGICVVKSSLKVSPNTIEIKALDELVNILTQEKDSITERAEKIYKDIFELNKLSCKGD